MTLYFVVQMKFAVYDINKDLLEVTVFDKDLFSPNGKSWSVSTLSLDTFYFVWGGGWEWLFDRSSTYHLIMP